MQKPSLQKSHACQNINYYDFKKIIKSHNKFVCLYPLTHSSLILNYPFYYYYLEFKKIIYSHRQKSCICIHNLSKEYIIHISSSKFFMLLTDQSIYKILRFLVPLINIFHQKSFWNLISHQIAHVSRMQGRIVFNSKWPECKCHY